MAEASRRPLRVLFSMRNFWYVKLFDSVIRELAARGHAVHILAEGGERNTLSREWNEAAASLSREHPTITFSWAPRRVEDDWVDLRVMIRLGIDHLRFLEPAYAETPKLAARARTRTPEFIVRLADRPFFRAPGRRRLIGGMLRAAERAAPVDADLAACVLSHRPDVILITPLLTLGSEQMDVLRTARRAGVPTALCVGSWDHLSSKALIRDLPDRVIVWNETQKREALELHRVPPERVVVTGAQCFDHWFDRQPALDRAAFCRKVGLDPTRPYILYVCSALFEGSPSEAAFVARWVAALRSSGDPGLARAGILVRPHPKRGFEWDHVDLSGFDNVALWPPRGAAPFDAPTRNDYFDSMFHAAVTVGLNTSALIESGIVGRAVHTILLPEFYENQEGTLHFRYLLDLGLLCAARDLPAHVGQLARSLAESDPAVHHNLRFVETFVRPRGLQTTATPLFADAIEELAAAAPRPAPEALWTRALRVALTPLARRTSGTFARQANRARRRLEKRRAQEARDARLRAERAARKAQLQAEREARRQAEGREREAAVARARAEKLAAKQRTREAREHEKTARLRRKQRQELAARLAAYGRRLARSLSLSR